MKHPYNWPESYQLPNDDVISPIPSKHYQEKPITRKSTQRGAENGAEVVATRTSPLYEFEDMLALYPETVAFEAVCEALDIDVGALDLQGDTQSSPQIEMQRAIVSKLTAIFSFSVHAVSRDSLELHRPETAPIQGLFVEALQSGSPLAFLDEQLSSVSTVNPKEHRY